MTEWVTVSEPTENGQAISTNSSPMTAEINGPKLMSQGSYAIYETPAGGWHVSYLPHDTEKTQHFEIPALAVQMFRQMQSGKGLPSPMEMMKKMMAARNG
jgi:hypothetical protein